MFSLVAAAQGDSCLPGIPAGLKPFYFSIVRQSPGANINICEIAMAIGNKTTKTSTSDLDAVKWNIGAQDRLTFCIQYAAI